MNYQKAEKIAERLAILDIWGKSEKEEWKQARQWMVESDICPSCLINEGIKSNLGPWQPGNSDVFSGKECQFCDDFFPCGDQPEYQTEPDCHSDADMGL